MNDAVSKTFPDITTSGVGPPTTDLVPVPDAGVHTEVETLDAAALLLATAGGGLVLVLLHRRPPVGEWVRRRQGMLGRRALDLPD
jgi:hypothetical protein